MSPYPAWKGKARAQSPRDDSGGKAGDIFPMKLVGSSLYEAIYTIPVLVGPDKQNISLQVDSGSSDLWIASSSCSQSSCGGTSRKYDSSKSTATGQQFAITYVEGEVTGPIVWDTVQLGGYVIDNQALAAANHVDDEPLSDDFSGIMGLALPLNSYIAEQIPPGTSNAPDGAAFASNLFGITPTTDAPPSRFVSLSLERPGSSKVPSLMGVGKHPPQVVPDPTKIQYSTIVSERSGAYFWKTDVKAITVYKDGAVKPVTIKSGTGATMPTAVIDSGMPIILASLDIANGIYGAMGIGPASDGQYYLPCDVPINLTITLDDRSEIPLHPLDLSATAPGSSSASHPTCMGVIQSFPADSSVGQLADLVLGVPFMRSTYTVMAYDPPDTNGAFPDPPSTSSPYDTIRPRLGLLALTDPKTALDEFNTVRVLNQPLEGQGAQTVPGAVTGTPASGKKLSVGVAVLIGLVGFFALCISLFAARWVYARRRYRRAGSGGAQTDSSKTDMMKDDDLVLQEVAFRLARQSSRSDPYGPSGDTLRAMRLDEQKRRTTYTDDTEKTRIALGDAEDTFLGLTKKRTNSTVEPDPVLALEPYQEFGYLPSKHRDSAYTPDTEYDAFDHYALLPHTHRRSDSDVDPDATLVIASRATTNSIPKAYAGHGHGHDRTPSGGPGAAAPLLAHTRSESSVSRIDISNHDFDSLRRVSSPRGPRPSLGSERRDSSRSVGSVRRSSASTPQDAHFPPGMPVPHVETSDIASPQHTRPSSPSPLVTALESEASPPCVPVLDPPPAHKSQSQMQVQVLTPVPSEISLDGVRHGHDS